MILRARNLFLAWLTYGALQLALLGVPGAAVTPGVGPRSARTQSESQSVSFGKRIAAPDISDRRAPVTPFAPAARVHLDLSTVVGRQTVVESRRTAEAYAYRVLPPARAPPALA
jgi:hypothetical protein